MNASYNFDEIMKPFWQSDIMYNESVLMLSENGNPAAAKLLFKPLKILSIRNSYLDTEYVAGEDWIYEDGLFAVKNSKEAANDEENEGMEDIETVSQAAKKDGL
ncbi:MAG: hypothetical protein A2Y21_09675 [Clostridiales bacterium GWC2_40_7]|nr:MAG: hypothetical protein A2Y21_09675 [Clostridiales bacterium GWC2_40_7]